MSPLPLRRYRAERLLESQFKDLQGRVVASVGRRLRAAGVELDACDLEACYAIAWQGLYAAVLDGQEIANPVGWLVLVAFRRAIEEQRGRARAHRGGDRSPGRAAGELDSAPAQEHDLAAELDDRARLRHLFEALRARLSGREREAAVLCYLQGLTRSEAATRMGVSDARMRKLMEGRGPGMPGVAGKVGALVETIRDGGWCEEQASSMRGLAFGILDPAGERYRLALMHRNQCPACRAYVTSLRGLAAAMPPVLLPGGLGVAALTGVGSGTQIAGGGSGAHVGRELGGNLSASGAASAGAGGSGAAGGGWLLAGGGKLAVGCLLAVSVGGGCLALKIGDGRPTTPAQRHHRRVPPGAGARGPESRGGYVYTPAGVQPPTLGAGRSGAVSARRLSPAARLSREFGPEQGGAASASSPSSAPITPISARAASSGLSQTSRSAPSQAGTSSGASQAAVTQANREFSPG